MIIQLTSSTGRNMNNRSKKWQEKTWNPWTWKLLISWALVQAQAFWIITPPTCSDQRWATPICSVVMVFPQSINQYPASNWIQGFSSNMRNSWKNMRKGWKGNGNNLNQKKDKGLKTRLKSWNKITRHKSTRFIQENWSKSVLKIS